MEKIIAYKALDGTLFESEEECRVYDEQVKHYKKINSVIKEAWNICEEYKNYDNIGVCEECPLYKLNDETCPLGN